MSEFSHESSRIDTNFEVGEVVVRWLGRSTDYSLLPHCYSLFPLVASSRFSKGEPGGRRARQMERAADGAAEARRLVEEDVGRRGCTAFGRERIGPCPPRPKQGDGALFRTPRTGCGRTT